MKKHGFSLVEILLALVLMGVVGLAAAQLIGALWYGHHQSHASTAAATEARKVGERLKYLIENAHAAYFDRASSQGFRLMLYQPDGLVAVPNPTTAAWRGEVSSFVRSLTPPRSGDYLMVNPLGQATALEVTQVSSSGSNYRLDHSSCPKSTPFVQDRLFALNPLEVRLGQAPNENPQTLYLQQDQSWQPLLAQIASFRIDYLYQNASGQVVRNPHNSQGYSASFPANYTSKNGIEYRLSYLEIHSTVQQQHNTRSYFSHIALKPHPSYPIRTLASCGQVISTPAPGNLAVTFTLPSGVVSSRFNKSATVNGPTIANTTFSTDRTWNNIEQGSYSVSAPNVNYEVSPGSPMLGIDPVYATYFAMVLPGNTVNVGGNATTTVNIRYSTTPLANLSITVRGLPAGLSPSINLSDAGGNYPISGSSVLQVFQGNYTLAASEVTNPGGGIPYTATLYQVSGTTETVIRNPVYGTPTSSIITAPGSYVVEYARNSGSLSVNITAPPAIAGLARVLVSGPVGATNTGSYAINDTLSANRNYPSVIPGDYSIIASPVSAGGLTYSATVTPQSPRVERNGATVVSVNYGCAGGSECVAVRVNVTASGGVSGTIGALSMRNHSTIDQNGSSTVTQNCPTAVGNTNCLPGAFALDNTVGLVHQDLITSVAQWATVGVRSSAVRTSSSGSVRCWRWDAVQGTTVSFVNMNTAANTPRVQVNYVLPNLNRRLDGTTLHSGTIGTVRAPSGVSGFGTYGWNSQAREEVTLNLPLQEVSFCYDSARDDAQRALDELVLKCPSYNGTTNVPYGLSTEQYRQLEQQYRNQLAACTVRVNVQGGQFVCTGSYTISEPSLNPGTYGFSTTFYDAQSVAGVGGICSAWASALSPNPGYNPGGIIGFTLTGPTCSFDVPAGPHYDRYGSRTSFQYDQAQAQQVCTSRALP